MKNKNTAEFSEEIKSLLISMEKSGNQKLKQFVDSIKEFCYKKKMQTKGMTRYIAGDIDGYRSALDISKTHGLDKVVIKLTEKLDDTISRVSSLQYGQDVGGLLKITAINKKDETIVSFKNDEISNKIIINDLSDTRKPTKIKKVVEKV